MTRIVTTHHGYKHPPRKRKAVALDAPVAVKRVKLGNDNRPDPALHPNDETQSAIVTMEPKEANPPPGLLPDTPEEHQRRGDAADALWRELVRRASGGDELG